MRFIKDQRTFSVEEAVGSKYLTILLEPSPLALLSYLIPKRGMPSEMPLSIYYPNLGNESYALEVHHLSNVVKTHFKYVTMYFDRVETKTVKGNVALQAEHNLVTGNDARTQLLNAVFNIAKQVSLDGRSDEINCENHRDQNRPFYSDIEIVANAGLLSGKDIAGISMALAEIFGVNLHETTFDKSLANKFINQSPFGTKALLFEVEKQIAISRFGLLESNSKKKR